MSLSNSTRLLALAGTVALAACGGSDGRREAQPIQDKQPMQPQQLTLTGCVQSGQLETDFVLQNVRSSGAAPSQDASQDRQTQQGSTPPPITEGSIVQLMAANPADLRQHVGQEVTVSGTLADTGENTIGTAGTRGNETPSGDRSMAASSQDHADKKAAEAGRIARQSMANGSAPIVRVSQVTATGRGCAAQQPPIR